MKEKVQTTPKISDLEKQRLLEKYEPIAIVGVGLRFPGGNNCLEELDAFLRVGGSGITPIPGDRWDVPAFHADTPGIKGKTVQ